MSATDAIYWWVGFATVWVIAIAGVTALLGGASVLAVLLATEYAKKFGNLSQNLRDMRAWVNNGRPKFKPEKQADGSTCFVMAPSDEAKP